MQQTGNNEHIPNTMTHNVPARAPTSLVHVEIAGQGYQGVCVCVCVRACACACACAGSRDFRAARLAKDGYLWVGRAVCRCVSDCLFQYVRSDVASMCVPYCARWGVLVASVRWVTPSYSVLCVFDMF